MLRALVHLLLLAALIATPTLSAEQPHGVAGPIAQPGTVADNSSPFKARKLNLKVLPANVVLDELLSSTVDQTSAVPPGTPKKIGEGRIIAELQDVAKTSQILQWQPTQNGGAIAAITISTSQAKGIRIGVMVRSFPSSALLRFYAPNDVNAFEVSGADVLKLLKQNLDAGDQSDAGHTYWGPRVDGDTVTLEIEVPKGVSSDEVQIAVPKLSHFFSQPLALSEGNIAKTISEIGTSASCEVDSMCYSATSQELDTVVHMSFVDANGGSHVCTGTLLMDTASHFIPYLLSANHCISKQTVASTLRML